MSVSAPRPSSPVVMCMPRKRACFLGYACAPRFHTEFWKQWQPRLPFFKNRAHAYQFCIPMSGIPPARLPKTGRMPTNFASRCRAYRPHGFQKQGACLPILHPDSAHAARTVFKSRAPIQPEHTWNSPRRGFKAHGVRMQGDGGSAHGGGLSPDADKAQHFQHCNKDILGDGQTNNTHAV